MAKTITRQILKLFGVDGDASTFGKFGSERAGSPVHTKDLPTIQALAAWNTGWPAAINASEKAPYIEDRNSLDYVLAYQLFYLLQEGIPEWNTDTTYFIGSIVKKSGTAEFYSSLTDDNTGNALPDKTSNVNWSFLNPGVPTGTVSAYAGSAAPSGYLLCDGAAVSRATFANLFNIVGTSFGSGDGSTTFNVPDLRGRFVRGRDAGAGRDPDAASRTAMNPGGATGDNVGSVEGDATADANGGVDVSVNGVHHHTEVGNPSSTFNTPGTGALPVLAQAGTGNTGDAGAHDHTLGNWDSETRPINANLNYIIKT